VTASGYPTPGDRIGAYLIQRRIGMGGMGMVFAATHAGLDRDVALKVIAPHLADDESFRARFTREARALAALDSSHVVHVYDHGEHDGHLYIAAQLIADGDLGTMLQARGAPPIRTAVDLIAQVTTGLADAHRAGIIHRDIKPANVLVRVAPDRIKAYLGDFGIARHLTADHTPTSQTVGTPSYMAPELHTGGTPGVASDVYSLGCLLWATLTGKAPYAGTSDYEIAHAHVEAPIPQLPDGGPLVGGVNRVLRSAMAKDPAERPPTAAALRDDLWTVLRLPDEADDTDESDEPGEPGEPGEPAAVRQSRRRSRVPLVVAGVVVAGILAGLGWWQLSGDDGIDGTTATRPTASSPPSSRATTPSPSATTPSPSGSSEETGSVSSADEQKAIATLTEAIETQGLEPDVAACAAQGWVDAVGVPRLVEAGVLTEELEENTEDLGGSPDPDVAAAGTNAAVACLSP